MTLHRQHNRTFKQIYKQNKSLFNSTEAEGCEGDSLNPPLAPSAGQAGR